MKKTSLILSIVSLVAVVALGVVVLCADCTKKAEPVETEVTEGAKAGSIVYFSIDRVTVEYEYAQELSKKWQEKAQNIEQEINRRSKKFEKDYTDLQDQYNKGLITNASLQVKAEKLEKQRADLAQYVEQKNQEVTMEQQEMLAKIGDAIKEYIDEYNAVKGYAMILSTSGDILPAPVAAGAADLDITQELIDGLNAKYRNTKK